MTDQRTPSRDGRAAPTVGVLGPADAHVRSLLAAAGVDLVAAGEPADVVHVTVGPAAVLDAAAGLLDGSVPPPRTVVLHARPAQPDPEPLTGLADAAAAAGTVVVAPFAHRFYPMVRLARRRVRSATPGPVHVVHGWAAPAAVSDWFDLVEFATRHRVVRLLATAVSRSPADRYGATAVLFETDRGAVGTLATSAGRPVDGGSLHATLDGVEETIVFHEGRPEVLDVVGSRGSQRFQRGVGADVSRYSTGPAGRPQGWHDCWAALVSDAHASSQPAGALPDGLPTLADLARSAALTAALSESAGSRAWVRVRPETDLDLLTSTEGKTA